MGEREMTNPELFSDEDFNVKRFITLYVVHHNAHRGRQAQKVAVSSSSNAPDSNFGGP